MDSSSIEESDSDSDEKLSTLTLSVGKNTPSSKSTPGLTLRKHPREKKTPREWSSDGESGATTTKYVAKKKSAAT